jgi:hypothetical protein
MAVVIEKTYGRAKLIEVFCDHRKLLSIYNEAATRLNQKSDKPLALWSSAVVNLENGPPKKN